MIASISASFVLSNNNNKIINNNLVFIVIDLPSSEMSGRSLCRRDWCLIIKVPNCFYYYNFAAFINLSLFCFINSPQKQAELKDFKRQRGKLQFAAQFYN